MNNLSNLTRLFLKTFNQKQNKIIQLKHNLFIFVLLLTILKIVFYQLALIDQ